jgi:hypothetical protein
MKRAEDLLMDSICFGHTHSGTISDGNHIPTIWEVAYDLQKFVQQGLLVEIPITCSLSEVLETKKYFYNSNEPPQYLRRLLESDYMGKIEKVQFRTIPGNTLYELDFTKSDRTPLSGHFKKLKT